MEILFYIAATVTVLATLRVITHVHAVHALLYLVVALIALALIFYLLGAQFAAALEIIIYGGAIMVLFIFVVMLLGPLAVEQERSWLTPGAWVGPSILALVLLGISHCGWGPFVDHRHGNQTERGLHRPLRTLYHRGGIGFHAVAAGADRRLSLGASHI